MVGSAFIQGSFVTYINVQCEWLEKLILSRAEYEDIDRLSVVPLDIENYANKKSDDLRIEY